MQLNLSISEPFFVSHCHNSFNLGWYYYRSLPFGCGDFYFLPQPNHQLAIVLIGVVLLSDISFWVRWLLFLATTQLSTHNSFNWGGIIIGHFLLGVVTFIYFLPQPNHQPTNFFNWVGIIIRAHILVVVTSTFWEYSLMIHPQQF